MQSEDSTSSPSSGTEKIKLKRSLSLINGITIIVGCIVGSGIFVTPKEVHVYCGSVGLSLIMWVAGGALAGLGAYCYAELGTLVKKSGGDYAYISEAFGPAAGFIRLWMETIIIRPAAITISALTFAKYVIAPLYEGCGSPKHVEPLLAACCILLVTFINCMSVKWAARMQDVLTYSKVISLLLIIITGLVRVGSRQSESFFQPFTNTTTDPLSAIMGLYMGLYAYNGWNYLNFIVEELQNPARNLPAAIFISCLLVTFIYTFTNASFYAVLQPEVFVSTDVTAMEFARRIYGKWSWIMPLFIASSTLGACNGGILTASRLFFVGAREGQMPRVLALISTKRMTPITSVLAMGVLSLLFLALSDNIKSLISYKQVVQWLAVIGAIMALFCFRRTKADHKRVVKVNLIFPIIFLCACIILVITALMMLPKETFIGLAIMLTGVPVYYLFIRSQPAVLEAISTPSFLYGQKLLLAVPEEKDE